MTPCLQSFSEIEDALSGVRRILIASDFDGTLCAIEDTPAKVRLTARMLAILRSIVACERLELAVISGRSLEELTQLVPLDIPLAGNHGLEIAGPRLSFVHAAALGLRPKLRSACDALTRELRRWPGAWVENKGLTATLHFRQIDCSQRGALLFAARRVMGRFGATFALRIGIQCLEIRPRVEWDKGSALARILDEMGPFDACVCLGDDRTDEGMFRSDRAQIGVRVGFADDTAAGYYVPSQDEVPVLLSRIVELAASAAPPRARLNRSANPSHPAVQYAGPAAPLQLSSKSSDSGR